MNRAIIIASVAFAAVGCIGGSFNYTPPMPRANGPTPIMIQKSRSEVWKALVPAIASTFFVVNNMDQSSGFVNVSYNGDPEQYVDCGQVHSSVANARGTRTYDFPAARASQQYESKDGSTLYQVDRRMALEGRANIALEELSASSTRATVNIRYVVTRTTTARPVGGSVPIIQSSNVAFNSGDRGAFPATAAGTLTCVPTGILEQMLTDLLRK